MTLEAGTEVDALASSQPSALGVGYRLFRRTLDISVSLVLMVVAVPALAVIAVVIKLTSRGPVLFVQTRVGRAAKPFSIMKFRTMRDGTHDQVLSDSEQYQRYVANGFKLSHDDPRITRAGRWLRKLSLDELPQLINVLVGQMSVVGVRPLVPEELARRTPSDQSAYAQLRPGLTGLWQVAGRSSLDEVSRIDLDREYLAHLSVHADLAILVRTPGALLRIADAR